MTKPLSDALFAFKNGSTPSPTFKRCLARDLGLHEAWFRDAIFAAPELVIGACRAADVTDDDWYAWEKEFRVGVGPIDVLLLSSEGRVAIVETKLASNPELRRHVLAQALDYLTHLPDALDTSMPSIPLHPGGEPVADIEDIRDSVQEGNVLVIIVSDDIHPRAARLSETLLANNSVKEWQLVFIDLALYRDESADAGSYMIVPSVRNLILPERRQTVRVIVQGEAPSARIEVERVEAEPDGTGRQKWDEDRFFAALSSPDVPEEVRDLARNLRALAQAFPKTLSLAWGTGRRGSMVLKRADYGLIEVHGRGHIRFRPRKFSGAVGEQIAAEYRQALEKVAPRPMTMKYPLLHRSEAAGVAAQLYKLVERSVAMAEGQSPLTVDRQ